MPGEVPVSEYYKQQIQDMEEELPVERDREARGIVLFCGFQVKGGETWRGYGVPKGAVQRNVRLEPAETRYIGKYVN